MHREERVKDPRKEQQLRGREREEEANEFVEINSGKKIKTRGMQCIEGLLESWGKGVGFDKED